MTRIFSPRSHEEHEEKLDRVTGLTEVFSRLRTVIVSHKNAQKGALLVIYSPKCTKIVIYDAKERFLVP
jgi:hypothetical protein